MGLLFFSESRKANFTYKDGRIFSGNFVSGKVNNKAIIHLLLFIYRGQTFICVRISFIVVIGLSLAPVWPSFARGERSGGAFACALAFGITGGGTVPSFDIH